ncbi:hypothetical protein F3I62_16725 [Pseudomonas sp. R-28-1W-6]|uniref:hypothetical protein n=1 Tax=Pseudomonas sp. R-28-1W-6 TaxID=2650101 RepID=UPI0013661375|nr:hypothetical protein [Pseudomonas sp. R-28-1W-6]MWV13746.1 hypothetical protein [Pseudomonas sp. R-28-1W-6]
MATEFIQVCRAWTTNTDNSASCSSFEWIQGYVLPPEAEGQLDLLIQGGFSAELFQIGFGGTLTLFAIGFGVGLVISQLRKLKR